MTERDDLAAALRGIEFSPPYDEQRDKPLTPDEVPPPLPDCVEASDECEGRIVAGLDGPRCEIHAERSVG